MTIRSLRTLIVRISYGVALLMLFAITTRRSHAFDAGWCNSDACSGTGGGGICEAWGSGNGYCACYISVTNHPGSCACLNCGYYGCGNNCS